MSADKEEEAMKLLADNADVINTVRSQSSDQFVQDLIAESVRLQEKIKKERTKQDEYEASLNQLESQVIMLKNELSEAKKKDAIKLRESISEKESEMELLMKITHRKIF